MKIVVTALLAALTFVFITGALFVSYFKLTRKGTWREALAQALSDILM